MQAKAQLLEQFPTLSPALKAAARFVVDHPNEVVVESMRSLAERAGAQPATLVRLAQTLGYSGWPALKSAFAFDLGLHTAGYGERAKSVALRSRSSDLLSEMFTAQQQNLASTAAECAVTLRQAAKLLHKSRTVHVAAFRASYPVALSFAYGYRLFRDSVHLLDGQGGGLEMQLRPIQRQDVVLVISFAPYSREPMQVINTAKSAGARVIALTDSNASPLALAADVAVLFAASSPSFFPSITAAIAVTEALLELLVADAGDGAAQKIDEAEQQLFSTGGYLQTAVRRRQQKLK